MNKNSYKKKNYWLIIYFLTFVILFLFLFEKVTRIPWFYAYDPWDHYLLTKNTEDIGFYSSMLHLPDSVKGMHYPTFLRSSMYILWKLSGVNLIFLFQLGGPFFSVFKILLIILIMRRCMSYMRNVFIFFTLSLLLTNWYLVYRAVITYPEHMVMIFLLLQVFFSVIFLKKGKYKYYFFLCFFTLITIYTHQPSFIFSITILTTTLIIYYFSDKWRFYKNFIFLILPLVYILTYSIWTINSLIHEYIGQLNNNVWQDVATYGTGNVRSVRISDYYLYSSTILFIFWITALINIKKFNFHKNPAIPVMFTVFIVALILSGSLTFGFNLPIDRMMGFVFIFGAPLLYILYCSNLFWNIKFLTPFVFILAILNFYQVNSWQPHNKDTVIFWGKVNQFLEVNNIDFLCLEKKVPYYFLDTKKLLFNQLNICPYVIRLGKNCLNDENIILASKKYKLCTNWFFWKKLEDFSEKNFEIDSKYLDENENISDYFLGQ